MGAQQSGWSNIAQDYALLSTGGSAEPDFVAFSAELTALWSGVCEISFHDLDSMIERASTDPSATAAPIEVVREAVGNAIRHGGATALTYEWSSESSSSRTRIAADLTWSPAVIRP